MVMLNNSTFGNSKNYFTYNTPNIKDFWQLKKLLNTLLYNTPKIKSFIFFTTSFKYSFVILPLCLFLSLPSPPPPFSLLWSKSNQQTHTSFFSTQQTPPLYSQPYNPIPTTSHQYKKKKRRKHQPPYPKSWFSNLDRLTNCKNERVKVFEAGPRLNRGRTVMMS